METDHAVGLGSAPARRAHFSNGCGYHPILIRKPHYRTQEALLLHVLIWTKK
jgi:hypothetical protein